MRKALRLLAAAVAALTLGVPSARAVTCSTYGATTASSSGTAVVGGLNAKGSWVQFSASTGHDIKILYAFVVAGDTTAFLFDIGTGGAGAESVLVPNIVFDQALANNSGMFGPIPTSIAAGTRIAARAEADDVAGGNETLTITLMGCDEGLPELTATPTYVTYGATAGSTTKSTAIDPGGSAHTKGAWVEITAAAQANIQHAWLVIGNNGNQTTTTASWLVDVAIGAESSEVVELENVFLGNTAAADQVIPIQVAFPGEDLAGQRIAVRAQSSITDATDRIITAAILTSAGTPVGGGSNAVLGAPNKRGNRQQ